MPILFSPDLPAGVSAPPGEGAMDQVATHQRLLVGAALRTTGPILELGVGWYSTPLLHEIAEATGRTVLTADNNPAWLRQFEGLRTLNHQFELVGWWGEFYETQATDSDRWGLVFVDHAQPIEREYAVRALLHHADVFVLHDTEEGFAYGYDRTLPMFKYQWTDKCQRVYTTVASNT